MTVTAEAGGTLGLMLGASWLTIMEFLQFGMFSIYLCCKRRVTQHKMAVQPFTKSVNTGSAFKTAVKPITNNKIRQNQQDVTVALHEFNI